MIKNKYFGTFLAFLLTVSFFTVSLPQIGNAQTSAKTSTTANDLQSRLSKIEAKLEKRRKELGIPGVSLAIVKDGKVIYSKGLGYKDFENKVPITADTQLAIGSATKAFTGLSVLMSQDEGKLSIDDSPKKYLPYFKINDPEIDKKITIRNLLSHSSGLNRTDLGWITGKLNTKEIIRVAGEAKPMAGLHKKFYYQNVMFLTAGEIVSTVQKKPWVDFVSSRIFEPLEMNNSTLSIKQMKKAEDFSFGYDYNFDTKATRRLPTREILAIAPAGSINSSANDMAKWLMFILNSGKTGGNKLVSEKGFNEWIKPQMEVVPGGAVSYGFGWFLQDWKGKKVVQHGGNIDGFNSMVALMPEENLGFVMLTNVSGSSLGNELMPIVWNGILADENTKPLSDQAKKEVGKYKFPQAGFNLEVKTEDGKLVAKVPGQPTYELENVKGRKYKLSNAPAGFFITFKDDEAFLEQPQGNITLPKVGATKKSGKKPDSSLKELIGTYESKTRKGSTIKIKEVDGKVSLVVGQQPPYPLEKREDGNYGSSGLPPVYYLKINRDKSDKITGATMVQPQGEFEFKRTGKAEKPSKPKMSAEELIAKTIAALGGENNMRKITSRITTFDFNAIHQGVKGYGKSYQKAPNKLYSKTTLTAIGKKIGWLTEVFDGKNGGESYSFTANEKFTGKNLADEKVKKDMFPFIDWKNKFEKVEITRMGKVGNEKVYVLTMNPHKANRFAMYISTKTFLPVQKRSVKISSTSAQRTPITEVYSDYKKIDGIMIPFKTVTTIPAMGDIITTIKKIKHNSRISDKKFRP